jgi:transcriptional regulator with XRE-family HTH domain
MIFINLKLYGKIIKYARLKQNLTQEELANILRIHVCYIINYENNKGNIDKLIILKINNWINNIID